MASGGRQIDATMMSNGYNDYLYSCCYNSSLKKNTMLGNLNGNFLGQSNLVNM